MKPSGDLREERAPLGVNFDELREKICKHLENGEDAPSELRENLEKCERDYELLTEQIKLAERSESLNRDKAVKIDNGHHEEPTSKDKAADREAALVSWCRYGAGKDITNDEHENIKRCGANVRDKGFDIHLSTNYAKVRNEVRAQSTTAGAGGEFIPEGFVANIEYAQLALGNVRGVADVFRTASGNDLPWPTTNDTGNVAVILAENATDTQQDIVTSSVIFKAYKYSSKSIKISTELIEDSAFDMPGVVGRAFGERMARGTNAHFTTGTGTGQPKGVVTAATVGKTAALSAAITADEVIDLYHSVDPSYRGNAKFMMNDAIAKSLRLLKDGNGQFLWQPGMQAGKPDTLFGHEVVINQDMVGTFAINNLIMLFGDFSKYKIRDVASVRMVRADERFIENDQVGFFMFSRHDGNLLDAGTNPIKSLKLAAV